eukprot:jgi/Orpsp1_1/1176430/evm.model.c7180000057555.1
MMSANHNNHYIENMAGMFVSTLPLLLKYYKEEQRFIEIIKENMELLNNIYKNQDISFAELTEILKLKKMNNSFIFQPNISNKNDGNQSKSIFSTFEGNGNMKLNSLSGIENLLKNNNKSKFEIIFNVIENENNCYKIYIEYNNDLYDSIMIKRILDSYIEIMKNINSLENNNIRNIEYIPMDEKERIIKQFNYDVNKEGCDKLYHEEFRKIARKYPKRNAIIFNEMKITYKELDEMSNSLAYYLCLEEVKRNDIIPIICDRSPYYIIGILGISKAGGAFLPIDKNLPNERIQFILGEIKSKVILFSNCEEVINKLKNNEENTEYKMYDLVKHDYSNNCNKINNINEPDDTCYVLFTSGTTGNPKGVLIINNIYSLSDYILKNNIELINTTPSRLKLFLENEKFKMTLKVIKYIVLLGEELSKDLCKEIYNYSECQILNGYGPTEATITCTYKNVNEIENKISIGKPQCNYKIYILDKFKQPVPIGVEGEIYIGGYGVGKGYLNRPELTKEMFVENPFNYDGDEHNRIMYRTGDLGRWTSEGEIEYLGRMDSQVKINGQRVELGEIESKVLEMPEIQQCVVINVKKENGKQYLVCYYIPNINEKEKIINKKIRKYLTEKLPVYMIPNYYIRINEIPLSSTGKLNRRGLPEPKEEDFITETYVAPVNNIEKIIKINYIICDGYSYGILINELINIYNDKILDELPYQFSDYAIYFDRKLKCKEDAFIDQIQYYKTLFDCDFDRVRLPQKVSNNNKNIFVKKKKFHTFDNEIYSGIKKIIKSENISETTYFIVIICLVLSIHSKQKCVLTCITGSSRNNYYTEKLIGMFASKLPVLVKFENMNLIDVMRKYKNIFLTILSYDVPIKRLMKELNINSINVRSQYNPYGLLNNNENKSTSSKYLKVINPNEISTILGENNNTISDNDKDKDNDSSNKYDEYNYRHEIDLDIVVNEMENTYNLKISYNEYLYEENLIDNIINDISLIIKDKNYLYKNTNSIIDNIVNKTINI